MTMNSFEYMAIGMGILTFIGVGVNYISSLQEDLERDFSDTLRRNYSTNLTTRIAQPTTHKSFDKLTDLAD